MATEGPDCPLAPAAVFERDAPTAGLAPLIDPEAAADEPLVDAEAVAAALADGAGAGAGAGAAVGAAIGGTAELAGAGGGGGVAGVP